MTTDNPDFLPAWAIEYPHRGNPRVFRIESLDEMESMADSALADYNATYYESFTYKDGMNMFGGAEEMRNMGGAWERLADEKRGVVVEQGQDSEWRETEPVRSYEDRYYDSKEVLSADLSALKIVADSELAEVLEDDSEWSHRFGQCGGPAGRWALRARIAE